MVQFLTIEAQTDPTEVRFDAKARAPRAFWTKLHVLVGSIVLPKAEVAQGNRLSVVGKRQVTKFTVGHVRRVPLPGHDFALIINQPTEFDTNNPASIGFALFPDLLIAPTFTPWMTQFDAVRIGNREERWLG